MKREVIQRIRKQNENGFTLVEVIVGMFVLTIALMGMAILTGATVQGNLHGDKLTRATTVAQDKIEYIKNVDYDSISSGNDTIDGFTRAWNVTTDSPAPNMKTIDVTVTWQDLQGNAQEVVVSTIITNS